MKDRTASEKEIFHAALELTDAQQVRELLESACKNDPILRRQVEQLLAAHKKDMIRSQADGSFDTTELGASGPRLGQVIGNYKLLEKIGEGGFGIVYMADQLKPIQRRVALKIIKEGMDTKQVIARFEAERQALSLMNHVNIATVLDAGSTDSGRPYFVMELVRGVPVTEYCDEEQLSTSKRLEVFADICLAIQHAHQKGIIHRDIKPSNVLVTSDGDRPVPKVIDFGIAKATQGRLTDKTLFTQFRQFIGTPAYMSPEQARMSVHDVDTRTDIFSLGVLLYELLTGSTPLDAKKLEHEALDEICRRIREEDPVKPSTRLRTMTQAERTKIARNRSAEPVRLGWLASGELDWIVMKAIDKDRSRRYDTAVALAADISRYMANEPVEAGPPSMVYRLRKFASRNWVAVSTTTAVALALIVGTVASTIGLVQARRAELGEKGANMELASQLGATNRAREEAEQAHQDAEQAHQDAERARKKAELNLYLSDMKRASDAYDDGSISLALRLLARHEASYGDRFEWRYFLRLCQRGDALHTFREHAAPVKAVAVSAQGVIASGDSSGVLHLFDMHMKTRTARREMSSGIKDIDFAHNGQVYAVLEENNKLTLWELESSERIAIFPEDHVTISNIEFSPHDHTLVIAAHRLANPLRLWNWQAKNVLEISDKVASGRFVAISPTGKLISYFGPAPRASLAVATEAGSYEKYATLDKIHPNHIVSTAFSIDENYLATAASGQIKIWDVAEVRDANLGRRASESVSVLQGIRRSDLVTKLSFSPNGDYLASGNSKGTITLWRGRPPWHTKESELATFRGHTAAVNSLAYSHDGEFIVSGSDDHTIKLWPGDGQQESGESTVASDYVFALAFSPDAKTLAAGGFDGRVTLFDSDTMKEIFSEKLHENQVMGVAVSPNGKWLASCEGGWRRWGNYQLPGRGISLINLEDFEDRYYLDEVTVSVVALDFSPDSSSLVCGDANGSLWMWDVEQQRARKKSVETGGGMIWCLRYSPDGRTIAVGGKSRPLELRKADSFELVAAAESGISHAVDFSPDGQFVAFGRRGGQISLFNASNLKELKTLVGHLSVSYGISFLPDGKTLVSCSNDRTVKLWNVEAGQEVATFWGHRGDVTGLAVSRDGNIVASSSADKTIRMWRASAMDKPIHRDGRP